MNWQGNYFHAENKQDTLAYPTFQVHLDTKHELSAYIGTAVPVQSSSPSNTKLNHIISQHVPKYIPDKSKHSQFAEEVQVIHTH